MMYVYSLFCVAVGAIFLLPISVLAFTTAFHTVSAPYEPFLISGAITAEKILLGELQGDPQMYEFTVGEESTAQFILVQRPIGDPVPFSLILVRVNEGNRGVEEVGRVTTIDDRWEEYDTAFGISLIRDDAFTALLSPGMYRLEVSAPENMGKYAVVSGTSPQDVGYFKKLAEIRTVQHFFDASIFALLRTPYVYIPLSFVSLCILFFFTRRYQRRLHTHA